MPGYTQKSKLSLKDVCDPHVILTQPDTVRRLELGGIIGKATGLTERTDDKTGEVSIGLRGAFRTLPNKIENVADREPMESNILWLPDFAHAPIEALLRKNMDSPSPDKNFAVNLGMKITVSRANNPQGYSWEIQPMSAEGHNPLDDLQVEYERAKQTAIAAPTKSKAIEHGSAKGKSAA